ncbi:MAG TPA: hypothetical protein PLN21_21340 [Gemmatales bacterium]|nr:hypothetical protein [Gemmatales bacterium]
MKSLLFGSDRYLTVQKQVKKFLNEHKDYLSGSTAKSTRAVGDAIQEILSEHFPDIVGDVCGTYSSDFARRAMADLAFEDTAGLYYVVDVKTHRLSTKFNMPNLTSVERLARFYEDDKNHFVLLMIAYDIEGVRAKIEKVTFVPIEFLDWNCLTIGALGWGQIQIANSNHVNINPQYSRKKWMLELCDTLLEFYPKEITKIDKRIAHFQKIREEWKKRKES